MPVSTLFVSSSLACHRVRDVFSVLAENPVISHELAESLKKMVGFRNIAVHNYQSLALPVVKAIIQNHLEDFTEFRQQLIAL